MGLNSVNIMGNITKDPELRVLQSGKSVCTMSIAANKVYTKNGEKVQEVSYFDVVVFGSVADNCSKYLKKGNGVVVEGSLKQERWEKDGVKRSAVRIMANMVHFLPKKEAEKHEPATGNEHNPDGSVNVDDINWEN